jgi:hypothetical protein
MLGPFKNYGRSLLSGYVNFSATRSQKRKLYSRYSPGSRKGNASPAMTSLMPQIGQFPGASRRICECIGQV